MFKITKTRIIIFIIVLLFIGAFAWRKQITSRANQAKIETTTVTQKDISQVVTASGKIEAKQQVNLQFQTGGKLSWIGVKEGDHVLPFTAIASLDTREVQKNLEKTLRDYSKERNSFEEDKNNTYKDKVITDTIKRILENNQGDLEKAVLDVELKSLALESSTLVTPIGGIVTHIDTPVAGVNVTPLNIITIADPTSLVFTGNVDEIDVGKLEKGQSAQISLDAFPNKKFTGVVSQIAFAAELSTGGATVYPVEITFADTDNLRIGLNGDVTITVKEIKNTLTIPFEALKETDTTKYVIKKAAGRYVKTPVTIGATGSNDIEITNGLEKSDEIVTKGFQYLPKELQSK